MKLDIIICCSSSGRNASRLTKGLFKTSSNIDLNIHLIKEKRFRERTLNQGMKLVGQNDLLILGDDIILTKGWDRALKKFKNKGDIIGFSMLYPNSNIIQDTGYDLIKIDENVTLEPQNRGKDKKQIRKFGYRSCDSICGCALFIKKGVLTKLNRFSKDGQNRWGEFIYTQQAKKLGYKVIVLGHFLHHHGKSTKSNKNIKYSSISWQLEKKPWQKVVKKYVDQKKIKNVYKSKLTKKFKNLLNSNNQILVYGIGTIAELIAKNANLKNIDFCTGLKEEVAIKFFNKKTMFYKNVNYKNYKDIIISPLYIAEGIYYNKLKKYQDKKNIFYKITSAKKDKFVIYDVTNLKN